MHLIKIVNIKLFFQKYVFKLKKYFKVNINKFFL
jgi:hypothetical protein